MLGRKRKTTSKSKSSPLRARRKKEEEYFSDIRKPEETDWSLENPTKEN